MFGAAMVLSALLCSGTHSESLKFCTQPWRDKTDLDIQLR